MALALNISRQYYARLENGAVAFWSDCEKLQQLSELLNCTPQYLLLMTKEEFGTALYDDHFSELIECMYFPIFGKKTYELPQIKPIEQTLSTLFQDILKTDEQKQLMIIKVIEETLSDKKPMEIIRNIMDDIMPIEKK